MDNLSIHKAKCIQELYDEDFKCMFLPPYSCVLNPIERVWSLVKREWRKRVFDNDTRKDLSTEERMIEDRRSVDLILS